MIIWGGRTNEGWLATGARYDPLMDSWTPVSEIDAPAARSNHTAVWTGHVMIVWGGASDNSGGRYEPETDVWEDTSTISAPSARENHTAVWTGSCMIVWGGGSRTGGMYILEQTVDNDGDGLSECAGDCNDGSPLVLPGALEICDGLDNDCDGEIDEGATPGLTGGVRLLSDRSSIVWASPPGATSYDIVKGNLQSLKASRGDFAISLSTCVEDDSPDNSCTDTTVPPVGQGFYYLVRTFGCGQNGTYDDGSASQVESRDPEIQMSPVRCP